MREWDVGYVKSLVGRFERNYENQRDHCMNIYDM